MENEYYGAGMSFDSYKELVGIVIMSDGKVKEIEEEEDVTLVKDELLGDAYAVVCVIFDSNDDGFVSYAAVNTSVLMANGLSERDVIRYAKKNMALRFPHEIKAVEDFADDEVVDENGNSCNMANDVLILESSNTLFGSSAILYDGVKEEISRVVGGDYYVVPFSYSYIVIIKDSAFAKTDIQTTISFFRTDGMKFLKENSMDKNDIITNDIFYYDSSSGRLCVYGSSNNKNKKKKKDNVIYLNMTGVKM